MKWFGDEYGAPYEEDTPHTATPVGSLCLRCDESIGIQDAGMIVPVYGVSGQAVYHYECHLRGIIGGLNHLRGMCTCCGGTAPPDPPEMTRREAARAAVAEWLSPLRTTRQQTLLVSTSRNRFLQAKRGKSKTLLRVCCG